MNNLDYWEQLSLKLDNADVQGASFSWTQHTSFGFFAIFSIKNYIYITGGYEGDNDNSDETFYLDVENWQLKYAGSSPLQGWSAAGICIETTKRAYLFGGVAPASVYYDSIYYSNEAFIPTVYPTIIPTDAPTDKPTVQPTSNPTNNPSKIPSQLPTTMPTVSV